MKPLNSLQKKRKKNTGWQRGRWTGGEKCVDTATWEHRTQSLDDEAFICGQDDLVGVDVASANCQGSVEKRTGPSPEQDHGNKVETTPQPKQR